MTSKNDYSSKILSISCDAAQPGNKEKWWNEFLDGTQRSKDEYVAAMNWFYSSDPVKLREQYSDKFYSCIDTIFSTKHRDYAEVFMANLKPINLARKSDIEKLEKIYSATHEDRTHFRKMTKIAIEDMEDIQAKIL